MDKPKSISATDLYLQIGTASAPVIIDARPQPYADSDNRIIVGARQLPDNVEQWMEELAKGHSFVVYSGQDEEVSQALAQVLCEFGHKAAYLEGGMAAWMARKLPTREQLTLGTNRWITRERPKIDRIACPWLIRRFIDPDAEFIYVPDDRVLAEAKSLEAIPYDVPDVEFTHEGDRCSFDTFLRIYDIADPPLQHLAVIVRGADTSRHDLAPQCGGLFAISLGLSANFPDDRTMLEHGMVIYDALYTWCRSLQAEAHGWPPRT